MNAGRQRGLSLISMLIGLLVSLLVIMAMLATYRMIIDIAANSAGASRRDGQWAAALEAARMETLLAGYGIERAVGPVEANVLALSHDADSSQVSWRYRLDGVELCAGLRLSGAEPRGLFWLAPKACASAADASWDADESTPLAGGQLFFQQRERSAVTLAEAGIPALAGARFALAGECTLPYAQQAETSAFAQRLALRAADGSELLVACLGNLQVASNTPPAAGETP